MSAHRPKPMPLETTTQRLVIADGLDVAMRAAADILAQDGIVVCPTESFYGLAVRADSEAGVARLAELKARVGHKPIPLLAAGRADIERIGPLPVQVEPLVQTFWPGPLTVAIPMTSDWPSALAGDTGTLGVRIPDHPVARRLAAMGGGLITASSANLAGEPPATMPNQLEPALLQYVHAIIDAGLCGGGLPSTVVGVRDGAVVVLRPGAVSNVDLERVLGHEVE